MTSKNNITNEFLTHHWPICNGEMRDHISSADMKQGAFTNFTTDRFGNENSALALNMGWTQVPPGIYFNTPEFTISAWVYPEQLGFTARLIDFGNGTFADNIFIKLDSGYNSNLPALRINNGSSPLGTAQGTKALKLNQWQLVTATFDGYKMHVYLNGTQTGTLTFSSFITLETIERFNNYIGQSNWPGLAGYSNLTLDDLRFYKKSLSQSEIVDLMNQNEFGKN